MALWWKGDPEDGGCGGRGDPDDEAGGRGDPDDEAGGRGDPEGGAVVGGETLRTGLWWEGRP